MTTQQNQPSIQKTARIAGFFYLLLGVFGAFGMLYATETIIVPGDAAETAKNILESESLFRAGIVARLLTQVVQIFTVYALFLLLAPVNKHHARMMSIFVLLGVPIAMLNEINPIASLLLLSGNDFGAQFNTEELQSFAYMFIDLHAHGIIIDHIFWGLWLFPMGYLVFKSGFLPKWIGIMLMIGCFGYLMDFFIFMLVPESELMVSQFTFIGELALPLWLVIKGVNVDRWQEQRTSFNQVPATA